MDAHPILRQKLRTRLERYIIADDVQIEDVTDQFSLFHVLSGESPTTGHDRIVSVRRFAKPGWDIWSDATRHDEVIVQISREFGEVFANAAGIFGVGQWFPGTNAASGIGPSEAAFLRSCSALHGSVPDYPAVQAAAGAVIAAHCVRLAGGTSRESLWQAARGLEVQTLFGGFRIDAAGVQVGHDAALVRWTPYGPVAA